MSGRESHSKARTFARRFVHLFILRPLMKLIFGVHVRGREHLSEQQKFIIIANHNSHLDIILLFNLLTLDQLDRTHAVAEKTYFSKYKWLFRSVEFLYQPIWIERGTATREEDPFDEFKHLLDSGHNLIIFPEGTRGKPGVMLKFRSGIGRLVIQYPDVPIVPVFMKGPDRALPKSSAVFLPLTQFIAVGPAQKQHGDHREITRDLESALRELGQAVSLSHQRKRGTPERGANTIAVLGIDGSGKSTISRSISESLSESQSVCRISDTLEFFNNSHYRPLQPLGTNVFREAINRAAKNAKSLKLYKIPKLTELLLRNQLYYEIRRWYAPDQIVMDGSPLLNILAWVALYRDEPVDEVTLARLIEVLTGTNTPLNPRDPLLRQFPELKAFSLLKLNRLILPETVLLIDVDPQTACDRIDSRGEAKQVHETTEKLNRLRTSYLSVMSTLGTHFNTRTCIIDGNAPLADVVEQSNAAVGHHDRGEQVDE
jgi:1-acyl-sn-glycerol-3-phosphate acyltransferase